MQELENFLEPSNGDKTLGNIEEIVDVDTENFEEQIITISVEECKEIATDLESESLLPDSIVEHDPTVPQHVKDITEEDIEKWNKNSANASNIIYEDNTGQGVDNVQDSLDEAFRQIEGINNGFDNIDGKKIHYEDDYGYGTPDNIQEALDFAFEELDNRAIADDVYNNYVSCTTAQNLSTTKQNRARTNIGIPQTCIMYNQVQNLTEGNKSIARANMGVRAFRNLGEIDLSDYDDDVFTFMGTLIDEGTYKFIDNVDNFVYIVETWWLGDYSLGQKYFYEEEGYTHQYYRNGYYDEDNGEFSWDDWTYYITDDVASQMYAQRSHVHFYTINTPYDIRAYLDSITNYSLKDLRVTSSANKHIYIVRVDYVNYKENNVTKYVRYQEYYDIEEPNKVYKRTGLGNGNTTSSKVTWEDWYVFEGVSE